MMKVKDSYNLNRLSAVAAIAALQDLPSMRRNVRRIQRERAALSAALDALGFQVYDSQTNFVLARRPGTDMRAIQQALKRRKILIRYFNVPGLHDCLRITIGTPAEMKTLLTALRRAVADAGTAPVAPRPWRRRAC
jgi:histidinol-phosphate aminotransferase